MMGVTIRVKNDTSNGTQCNFKGEFTLPKPVKQGEIIVFSSVGYVTQELPASKSMTVRMKTNTEVLEEVVVVGYGSGRAIGTTTASVVKVTSKDLESKPTANVLEGLQGKVSGLNVALTTGEPGELASIKLHGTGSLGLGSSPMYILDGIPVAQGTIMGLNPNDFESVQVLKDASATSIYGSRASNGVIFITSKRGKAADRALVTLTAQYGVSNLANRNYYDNMMTADELADFWVSSGLRTKEYVDAFREEYPHNTNWTDYFYRHNAPLYNASLSISGGANNTSYYISGQHYFNQGLFAGKSEYTKSNFRVNLNTKVNDWLSFYTNNGIYYDNSLSANSGHSAYTDKGLFYTTLPFFSPYKENGEAYYDEIIPGYDWYSPYYVADMYNRRSTTFEYLGNLGFTIRPVKGLVFRSNIGLDFSHYYYKNLRDPRAKWGPKNGSRNEYYSRGIEWTFSNTAEYRFNIAEDHDFTLLLGHEYNQYDGNNFSAKGSGIKDYRLMHFEQVTDPEKKEIASGDSQYAYLSFFGRLSYGLLDRYFLDFTLRNDASSKFPPKKRNAMFWSAGIKWNAKKESFLENVKWLDQLDTKFSIGTAGNSSLGNYAYFATTGPSDPYKNEASRVIIGAGNPELTWEKQRKTTLAFDVRMFRRFGFNLELYHRLTTEMVMGVPNPYTTGISSNTQNVGTYMNRGIDLKLDIDIWKDRLGNYASFFANFNYNQDKVLKLFQGLDTWPMPSYLMTYQVGKPVMFYMPIFKQVNPETGDPEWYIPGEDKGITTKDDNNVSVGYYNEEQLMQNTGVPRYAPYRGGFGFDAQYKGFFLNADFAFFLGKKMINNDLNFSHNPRKFNNWNTHRDSKNYWKEPGDKTILPDIKRYTTLMQFDTRMLMDASFLRLRNLTIGYEIPKSIMEKQDFFKGVKISVTGRNLLTFTKYNGPDPEPETNLTYGMNPATQQIVGTIELKF